MLAILITAATTAVLANDDRKDVNAKVISSFERQFVNAEKVQWEKTTEYTKVSFVLNRHRVIAFFDEKGTLLGTARDILFSELPLNVAMSVNRQFDNPGVYGIFEVSNEEGISYHMTIDTPKGQIQAQAYSNGDVTILGKAKK